MEKLTFSYNWNNKLRNNAFTTVRLSNEKRYFVGNKLQIFINGSYVGDAEIIAVKQFLLHQINPYISYLDAGYSVEEFIKLVCTMYKYKDMATQPLQLILLKYITKINH